MIFNLHCGLEIFGRKGLVALGLKSVGHVHNTDETEFIGSLEQVLNYRSRVIVREASLLMRWR
jgi:hypothetical protein